MSIMDQPLRTRERAAVDTARAALRRIVMSGGDPDLVRAMAENALERMSVILGEREGRS